MNQSDAIDFKIKLVKNNQIKQKGIKIMKKTILSIILSILLVALSVISTSALNENDSRITNYACGLNISTVEDLLKYDKHIEDNTRYYIPNSVDLSQSNCFPAIGNQGDIGSCASWATTYYQFGYQVATMNNWDAKHDLTKCFSPKFVFNIAKTDNSSSFLNDNYSVLKNCGAVRYSEFVPSSIYSDSEVNQWCTNTEYLTNALRNRVSITNYGEIFNPQIPYNSPVVISPYSEYLNMMKHLLYTDHILVIETIFGVPEIKSINGVDFTGNSNWSFGLASNGDIVCTECISPTNNITGHALAVVGYDDNIWYDYNNNGLQEDSELGAFKIANSWSEDYCNDGYVWVMYDALNKVSSNLSLNSNRKEAFIDYRYHYIEVGSYDLDLIAKVKVSHYSREDLAINIGISSLDGTNPSQNTQTLFMKHGGSYPIEGINLSPIATVPFDYGTFINGPRNRKCYYLNLGDFAYNDFETIISKVQLIDKTGHIVIDDNTLSNLNSSSVHPLSGFDVPDTELRRYRIGMLGDVDNNASVEITDSTFIQRYLIGLIDFSDDDLRTADVTGDGIVDIDDASIIQCYCIHYPVQGILENGYFCAGYFVDHDKIM